MRCQGRMKAFMKCLQYVLFAVTVTYVFLAIAKIKAPDTKEEIADDGVTKKFAPNRIKPITISSTTGKVESRKFERASGVIRSPKAKEPIAHADGNAANPREPEICRRTWKTDWDAIEKSAKPLIELDSHRFIYPMLINGPNNQLIGLRDTMYLAIRLNRTLILPHFFKHKTDSSVPENSIAFIPASQRVDVASISSLMSVRPFAELKPTCKRGFDDIYFTSYSASHSSLKRLFADVGIPANTKTTGELVSKYPKDMKTWFSAQQMRSDKEHMLHLYDSPGKCALYAFPFRTVGVKERQPALRKMYRRFYRNHSLIPELHSLNPDSLTDEDLYALIVHATPKPRHIPVIVADFMDVYGLNEKPYLAVHWRYDPEDWQTRCSHQDRLMKRGKEGMIEMCEKVKAIEPLDVARAILSAVRNLKRKNSLQIQSIYFAAPLPMEDFSSDMTTEFSNALEEEDEAMESIHILTQSDLRSHLEKFASCEGLRENFDDIFSQLEMGICSHAASFLRSPTSSWSKVIQEVRATQSRSQYDGNIFDLAWNAAFVRMND